jgi:hypothetical protein
MHELDLRDKRDRQKDGGLPPIGTREWNLLRLGSIEQSYLGKTTTRSSVEKSTAGFTIAV